MSLSETLRRAGELLASADEPTRLTGVHLLRDGEGAPSDRAAALVPVLTDPGSYVPHAARAALQTLGAAALPALLAGLAAEQAVVRAGCAWALAVPQAERARDVAEALAARAGDAARDVRHAVATGLGRIGCVWDAAEPSLSRLLRDPEPRVRGEALRSVGRLGAAGVAGAAARELLTDGLDDARGEVRGAAIDALRRVAPWPGLAARVQTALDEEPAAHVADDLRALLEELHT